MFIKPYLINNQLIIKYVINQFRLCDLFPELELAYSSEIKHIATFKKKTPIPSFKDLHVLPPVVTLHWNTFPFVKLACLQQPAPCC